MIVSPIKSLNYLIIEAIICFDYTREKKCEEFNGITSKIFSPLNKKHQDGGLSIYNGQPIAIGGKQSKGLAEIYTDDGWNITQAGMYIRSAKSAPRNSAKLRTKAHFARKFHKI